MPALISEKLNAGIETFKIRCSSMEWMPPCKCILSTMRHVLFVQNKEKKFCIEIILIGPTKTTIAARSEETDFAF